MLDIDDKAGVLYPCNVVVQERIDGKIEVSAIDPQAMFQVIENLKRAYLFSLNKI